MIFMEKELRITLEQRDRIVAIIRRQCERHLSRELYYQDLNYAPYAGNRGEHSITLSVLSGFRPQTKIPGLSISLQKYGLKDKMGQPVLMGDNIILHIYNSGCGFTSKPFRECCEVNAKNSKSQKLFVCIVFNASNKGVLKSIELKVPNCEGRFIYSELLYKNKIEKLNIA